MPTLHNREREMPDYRDQRPEYRDRDRDSDTDEREISLGTGTILALFFALALICAIFFGLGYSMGRKSAQTASAPPAATDANTAPSTAQNTFSSFKPSAGSPFAPAGQVPQPRQLPEPQNQPPADPDATIVTTPVSKSSPHIAETSAKPKATATAPPSSAQSGPAPLTTRTAAATAAPPMPPISPNGTTMVQIAAVSHQEDADVLIAALKKRGYAVFIRQEPQDHLLHVQVGPFATRKDADAMRQRLLSDGYNAILK